MRQMHGAHQDVRQALVTFVLEMVLGEPQRVVAALVHHLGDRFGLGEDRGELVVRITPVVRRGGILTMVGDVDVTSIHRHEFVDHRLSSPGKGSRRHSPETRAKRALIPGAVSATRDIYPASTTALSISAQPVHPFSVAGTAASASTQSSADLRQLCRCGLKTTRWVIVPTRKA